MRGGGRPPGHAGCTARLGSPNVKPRAADDLRRSTPAWPRWLHRAWDHARGAIRPGRGPPEDAHRATLTAPRAWGRAYRATPTEPQHRTMPAAPRASARPPRIPPYALGRRARRCPPEDARQAALAAPRLGPPRGATRGGSRPRRYAHRIMSAGRRSPGRAGCTARVGLRLLSHTADGVRRNDVRRGAGLHRAWGTSVEPCAPDGPPSYARGITGAEARSSNYRRRITRRASCAGFALLRG